MVIAKALKQFDLSGIHLKPSVREFIDEHDFESIFRILEMEYKKLPAPSVTTIAKIKKTQFLVLISTIISLRTK